MTLVKLNIPEDWTVIFNTLEVFNISNLQSDDPLWNDLTITLLAIKNEVKDLNIDVGWYPEFEPEGNFELKLTSVDWQEEYFVFKTRSESELIKFISFIFEQTISSSKEELVSKGLDLFSNLEFALESEFPLLLQPGWNIKLNNYYHSNSKSNEVLLMENSLLNCKLSVNKDLESFIIDIHQIKKDKHITFREKTFLDSYNLVNSALSYVYSNLSSFRNKFEIKI